MLYFFFQKQTTKSTPCSFAGPFSRLRACSSSQPGQGSQEGLPSTEQNGSPGPAGSNNNYTVGVRDLEIDLLFQMNSIHTVNAQVSMG